MLRAVRQDIHFAFRQFRRRPGFAVAVVLTLGLGIGATTTIFTLVDGILLRPLPFPHPERLVAIDTLEFPRGVSPENLAAANYLASSYPNFFDWQRQNQTFDSLASYDDSPRLLSKSDGSGARVILGNRVSANLFSTLGVLPALGRTFTEEEQQPGHRVVILSHELWASDFGSSPNVIGQSVKISDELSTIVGVMPAGFHYPVGQPAYFWATYAADTEGPLPKTSFREDDRLSIVGRLKPGVEVKQALADLNRIQRGLAQQYAENRYRLGVSIVPLLDSGVEEVRSALDLLFAAVGMLLVIGCANVAGLLLARANARRPEIALRTALGASRNRVVRQLFVEALLLALAGGAIGCVGAILLLGAGLHLVPSDLPRLYNISFDGRVLAFAVLVSAGTALMFGLLPAWRLSKSDPANALREGGTSMTTGRHRNRLQHSLVVAQTTLSFALLVGSGLLIRSVVNVLHLNPGFDTTRTVYFDTALTNARFPDRRKVAFLERLLPEVAALPGVEKASAGHPLPIQWGMGSWTNFTIANHLSSPDDPPAAGAAVAMPGYFETLSIPLLRGRTFMPHDNDPKAPPVALVNRAFARQFFKEEDAIGQYITPKFEHSNEPVLPRQIVGVVGDTRTEDLWNPYPPQFFLPYGQYPSHQRAIVVMKVSGDPRSYENAVRRVVAAIDSDVPIFSYRTFADSIGLQAAQPRFEALLVSGFAGVALFLSALGLYAVLSYIVSERMRELGLRIALGATRFDILGIVLRRAFILACVGIGIGAAVSCFATRVISDVLFNVETLDRTVFLTVTFTLMTVSIIAGIGPALRAANVDPIKTLREQ